MVSTEEQVYDMIGIIGGFVIAANSLPQMWKVNIAQSSERMFRWIFNR